MSYPVMSRGEAKAFLQRLDENPEAQLEAIRERDGGADLDWDDVAGSVAAKIKALTAKVGSPNGDGARDFESAGSVLVHEGFPAHPALSDPEFWTWVAVAHFRNVIAWRYPESKNAANYGVGTPVENLVFRLWLRGDIAYDPGDDQPYRLAAPGDIDFWRSHLFRQSYANGRAFARALISYQYPDGPDGKPRLKIDEIRELVKRLKNARSNLLVELMDEDGATRFIKAERAKLEAA